MKYFLVVLLLITQLASAEERPIPAVSSVDFLDSSCSAFNNPLKGLDNFTVLISNSSESQLLVRELEKIGDIKKFSLSDPKGINFEGMGTGARLLFFVNPLEAEGSKCQLTRITLCLSMNVEVLKTKNRIDSYVWASNQFVPKEKVDEAIKNAIHQFSVYQNNANPNSKPVFYVYQ